ncbi:hypothetical protein HZS_3480 [Henneguya salminicola]|nr:hypothetical protein HZS_3480 [Henneguya salminicola]
MKNHNTKSVIMSQRKSSLLCGKEVIKCYISSGRNSVKIGKIISLNRSQDEEIRSAKIRLENGNLTNRPLSISMLVRLKLNCRPRVSTN